MANMSYEEKMDAVTAFCDKYDSLIEEAPEGSELWVFKELTDAFDEVDKVQTGIWNETVVSLKSHLINAMLHIAERWANENTDIELTTTQLRAYKSIAKAERRTLEVAKTKSLKADGKSLNEIAQIMGHENELECVEEET